MRSISSKKCVTHDNEAIADQDQNAPEREDLKTNLVGEIDASTRPEVVIASSSSGLPSSTFIGQCKKNPGRVLIGHPFNPPHLLPLVEVVPHPGSDEGSIQTAMDFYKSIGKFPVHVKKEVPGHVANRLQAALNSEAYSLVARGVISAEHIGKGDSPRIAILLT